MTASYASTATLVKQIEQGAPADLFASADLEWMDYARDKRLIRDDTRVNLLGNRLVLIVPKDSRLADVPIGPGFDLAALAGNGRIVTADVRAVPAGRYAKAREMLDSLVKDVQNPALAEQFNQLKEKDPEVLRGVLGLALRANVQDNQVVRGREILELLQKTFPDNSIDVLKLLVQQLNAQIKELRARGESAKTQLDQTIASVSLFLELLAKQQEQAKTPNPELLLFIAQSYSSLDMHDKAALLLQKVEEPKSDTGDAEPKQLQLYHGGRMLYVRELRLDKKYDQAAAAPKALSFYYAARLLVSRELRLAAQSDNKDFSKAQQALNEILKTPWGKRSIDVQMERIKLLEAEEKYVLPNKRGAVYDWGDLMNSMQSKTTDNKIKEQYYDCYYHRAYCIYKYALKLPDAKKRTQNLRIAATYIVKLEALPDETAQATKKRFQELLGQEPALKEQYDELKKNTP